MHHPLHAGFARGRSSARVPSTVTAYCLPPCSLPPIQAAAVEDHFAALPCASSVSGWVRSPRACSPPALPAGAGCWRGGERRARCSPRSSSARHRCEPTKPVEPVTSALMPNHSTRVASPCPTPDAQRGQAIAAGGCRLSARSASARAAGWSGCARRSSPAGAPGQSRRR
jgi:hypothetical protein